MEKRPVDGLPRTMQRRSYRLDHFSHCGLFVAREVVHDHEVAGAQFWQLHLADISLDPFPIYRSIQGHRRDHAKKAQTGDQGRRYPRAMREAHAQPFTPSAPAASAPHVGCGPNFIRRPAGYCAAARSQRHPVQVPGG